MLHIIIVMQLLLSAASWTILYNPQTICAFERSSVNFHCSFDYPLSRTLKTSKWFRPATHQNQDGSQEGIFVYHTNAVEINKLYENRTEYANQDKDCTLKLNNVSRIDIGIYYFCFETNRFGKFTGSGGIKVNIAVLPFRVTVITLKENGHVHEGDSVILMCSTENCTPTQELFAWYKNKVLLPQATENVLRFSSVSHSDFGNYSCGLKNSDRTSSDEILLDVRYSPKHAEVKISSTEDIQEDQPVTLICESNANPTATNHTWFKVRETNVSYIGWGQEYYIRAFSKKDDGQYFCIAKNEMGSQNSTIIVLKVEEPRHQHLLLSAGVLLFGTALTLALFGLFKRRKHVTSVTSKPSRQTPTATEEVYENLRKSPDTFDSLTYADLMLPPTLDRQHANSQEDKVIYSLLRN